jgi:hypothetical protein
MAEGNGMSEMVLAGIAAYAPIVVERLMMPDTPRFVVAASEVVDAREAEKTQGTLASRLGREQLLAMARGDDTWARASLRARMFDTRSTERALTAENFSEVAYASTRMLHAWRVPAEIEGRPFIDASYTVGFPVLEVAGNGAERVLAIATSTAAAHRNLYMKELIPQQIDDVSIEVLAPEVDLKELGVDFTTASEEGLARAYDHGRDVARAWLDRQNNEDAAFMPPAW